MRLTMPVPKYCNKLNAMPADSAPGHTSAHVGDAAVRNRYMKAMIPTFTASPATNRRRRLNPGRPEALTMVDEHERADLGDADDHEPEHGPTALDVHRFAFVDVDLPDVVECDLQPDERLGRRPQCGGETEDQHPDAIRRATMDRRRAAGRAPGCCRALR